MGKYPASDGILIIFYLKIELFSAFPLIGTPLADQRQFILSSNELSNFEKMNGPSGIVVKAVYLGNLVQGNLFFH